MTVDEEAEAVYEQIVQMRWQKTGNRDDQIGLIAAALRKAREGMKERCATKCVEMSRAAQDHINHGMKMVPAPEAMRECAKAIRTITGDE